MPMTVCACWHGDRCPWFQRGQCWFRHEGLPPKPSPPMCYHDDLQELRDGYNKLREAVSKLAAAVMWRNGMPLPHTTGHESIKDAPQERISERTLRQNIESPVPKVVLAEPYGEAGSSWSNGKCTSEPGLAEHPCRRRCWAPFGRSVRYDQRGHSIHRAR